jgi:hypothetical protein
MNKNQPFFISVTTKRSATNGTRKKVTDLKRQVLCMGVKIGKHRLNVFESKVLTQIIGPNTEDVTGGSEMREMRW